MNLFNNLGYIDIDVFKLLSFKIKNNIAPDDYLQTTAELIRFNTLLSVARAGTGHLGASLSIVELLTEIYFRSFEFDINNKDPNNRDIFILSKGHAAPSLYGTLAAKGYFPVNKLNDLRRLGGLEGHCDICIPGIEANTGSLAMGLSKAVGYAIGKKRFRLKGNIVVIVGDGELQEGQCWEAFLSAASYKLENLYIIIDNNKVQTDQFTENIVHYGNLVKAWRNLGFIVEEGSGSTVSEISAIITELKEKTGKPKIFYCHTIKGQGVSYMESTKLLKISSDKYIWHNKSPNSVQLRDGLTQILSRIKRQLIKLGFRWNLNKSLCNIPKGPIQQGIKGKSLITGFANALLEEAKNNSRIVVIDGDLEEDCGFIPFRKSFPKRFFEMGIMEQHMVATTCALSRLGYLPIISTYAAFLTSRANEQLYNLASEHVKALIVGNMAGILPATPGKSHQAFRDISCVKNIPDLLLYQPTSADDIQNILRRYFRNNLCRLLYLRLSMAASIEEIPVPSDSLSLGEPQIILKGTDALIVGIGPVVLGECIKAGQKLRKDNIDIEIWNHPWLTEFNINAYSKASKRNIPLFIIEDHFYRGGFGESLMSFLSMHDIHFSLIKHISMKDFPQTGFRDEALRHFGLHRDLIASAIRKLV